MQKMTYPAIENLLAQLEKETGYGHYESEIFQAAEKAEPEIRDLIEENQKLREALGFCAHQGHYYQPSIDRPFVNKDKGETARTALSTNLYVDSDISDKR